MTRRKGESLDHFRVRKREAEYARRDKDREAFKAERARYRIKYRDKIRKSNKEWRDKNNEDFNAKQRARNKTPEYRSYRRNLVRRKRATDPSYRILHAIRARISGLLRGTTKSARTIELLGCDAGFLRLYLEARFEPWMNWANYGEWHIDHIIPCAEFDLTKPDQQKLCFHYTNLRPLRAAENVKWRDKRPDVHQPEFL